MRWLNVCFVGIGSIARRHIRNLQYICNKRGIALNIDAIRHNRVVEEGDKKLHIRKIYTEYKEIDRYYDIIFITNPTEYHIDTLKNVVDYSDNFFIEKPISSIKQLDKVKSINLKEDALYYVACPLRYNSVIQYLKRNIDLNKVISVRSLSSSYLPDWRSGIDYRNTYSACKNLGGGVSIDLIHEWDYLTYLFGIPEKIVSMIGKKSKLEIDSEDYAIYMAEYSDKIVELHLDYFGRKSIREVMIFTEEDTIRGDISNNRIDFMKSGKTLDFQESRDDFQIRELAHFLDLIEMKQKSDSDIRHAVKILELTQGRI